MIPDSLQGRYFIWTTVNLQTHKKAAQYQLGNTKSFEFILAGIQSVIMN